MPPTILLGLIIVLIIAIASEAIIEKLSKNNKVNFWDDVSVSSKIIPGANINNCNGKYPILHVDSIVKKFFDALTVASCAKWIKEVEKDIAKSLTKSPILIDWLLSLNVSLIYSGISITISNTTRVIEGTNENNSPKKLKNLAVMSSPNITDGPMSRFSTS